MFGLISKKKVEEAINDVYDLCDSRSANENDLTARYYDGAKSALDFLSGYLHIKPAKGKERN